MLFFEKKKWAVFYVYIYAPITILPKKEKNNCIAQFSKQLWIQLHLSHDHP